MERIEPNISPEICRHLFGATYSHLHNYIVPGLSSSLIAEAGDGIDSTHKVRLFTNSRTQEMPITPHSHRFDLACVVLHGSVENTIYDKQGVKLNCSDEFMASSLVYGGNPGEYTRKVGESGHYTRYTNRYEVGQWYFMSHDRIHSITFSKDAMVLVFEGDTKTDTTTILEPFVDGKRVETFKVEDWMFQV